MMYHYRSLLLLLFCTVSCKFGLAQTDHQWGSWSILTVQLPSTTAHKWGGYAEAQLRTDAVFSRFQYYEYKAGVSYSISKNFTGLLGAGRYITYDADNLGAGPLTKETRLWEQLVINQYLDRLKFEHRYRAEQRWLSSGYRNRFRYRLSMAIPLNKPKVEPNTAYISLYDEVFLNNRAPHFERNRLMAGMGYQFTKNIGAQLGWVNQYNYTTASSGSKNNLVVTLIYTLDRDDNQERMPATVD
ncbi:DUF2490 domain-containing protein [Pedobacter sp. BS3]|nr:DUF2490 domain-containing protein [Pedobacter sp. BS3]